MASVKVTGLDPLIAVLRGPTFKAVNRELRGEAKAIAQALLPDVQAAVRQSGAPQADKVAAASRAISDRKPTIVVGKNRPAISGFKRRGGNTKSSRVQVAHGVVYGPAGGRRDTKVRENYYSIQRNGAGGPLRAAMNHQLLARAEVLYLKAYMEVLRRNGFGGSGASVEWKG